jgi:hypothetical protein
MLRVAHLAGDATRCLFGAGKHYSLDHNERSVVEPKIYRGLWPISASWVEIGVSSQEHIRIA